MDIDASDQGGVKPGGSDWKPGGAVNCEGHGYGFQGTPCIHGVIMEGSTGRGNAEAAGKDEGALSAAPSKPGGGPETDDRT